MTFSILQFEDVPLPPWARFGRFGPGGTFALQMDASGLDNHNICLQKKLTPFANDVAMQARFFINSNIVATNNGFEGFTTRYRGYRLDGSPPNQTHQQVWDSTPVTRGPNYWHTENTGGAFETFSTITNIPDDRGIDFLDMEILVRGQSGQIVIASWECRHHFGKFYEFDVDGNATFVNNDLSLENRLIFTGAGEETYHQRVRYLRTDPVVVRKGQTMYWDTEAELAGNLVRNSTSVAFDCGILAKMRRKGTGTYDYFDIASRSWLGPEGQSGKFVTNAFSKTARHNYDQQETLLFLRDPTNAEMSGPITFSATYRNIEIDLRVADHVSSGG